MYAHHTFTNDGWQLLKCVLFSLRNVCGFFVPEIGMIGRLVIRCIVFICKYVFLVLADLVDRRRTCGVDNESVSRRNSVMQCQHSYQLNPTKAITALSL